MSQAFAHAREYPESVRKRNRASLESGRGRTTDQRQRTVSEDATWRDHVERWRHRLKVTQAWMSFFGAMSWRRRNGLWITWQAFETADEREIFMQWVSSAFFDAYRKAKTGDRWRDWVTPEVVERGLDGLLEGRKSHDENGAGND